MLKLLELPSLNESTIALGDVPKLAAFANRGRLGKRLNIATVYRWVDPGVGGVQLAVCRIGGGLYTTEAAVLDFIRQRTIGDQAVTDTRSKSKAESDRQRAEKKLAAAGI